LQRHLKSTFALLSGFENQQTPDDH
jgi:hypothetical protein